MFSGKADVTEINLMHTSNPLSHAVKEQGEKCKDVKRKYKK